MIPMPITDIARLLSAQVRGRATGRQVERVTTDSREVRAGDLFVAVPGPRFDGHDFVQEAADRGAAACLVRRDRNVRAPRGAVCLAVEDTVTALASLASYYRRAVMSPATVVIGITGSNGKTTTKRMLDHVLSDSFCGRAAPKSFNNHLGVPLTLLSAERDDRYLIVEIGTNAAGEVAALSALAGPHAAVITSIGEAHLEGLGGLEGVAAEKASILEHVRRDGLSVVNIDRPQIEAHLGRASSAKLITVGHRAGARLRVSRVEGDLRGTRFVLEDRFSIAVPMPGLHHAANAAATFAIARWFGLDPQRIIARIAAFRPEPGRTFGFSVGGVTVIDDAYNANPASMSAAVEALKRIRHGPRVLVMGDMLELGRESEHLHTRVLREAVEAGIERIVGVGAIMERCLQTMRGSAGTTRMVSCDTVEAATAVVTGLLPSVSCVWVKGSRAVGLDRLIAVLRERGGAGVHTDETIVPAASREATETV